MKVMIHWRDRDNMRGHRFLRWAQYILLLAGGLAVGFCVLAYFEAGVYQAYESRQFEESLRVPAKASRSSVERGSPVTRLEIPRLSLSVMVAEGIEPSTLKLGAGHVPGTAFPGEVGNIGIAGHRDTFFRKLRKIRNGDVISLATPSGSYRYSVEWARVANPTEVEVLDASSEPILTLITCYPFYFVGPSPERFIVRAREVPEDGWAARRSPT